MCGSHGSEQNPIWPTNLQGCKCKTLSEVDVNETKSNAAKFGLALCRELNAVRRGRPDPAMQSPDGRKFSAQTNGKPSKFEDDVMKVNESIEHLA